MGQTERHQMLAGKRQYLGFLQLSKRCKQGNDTPMLDVENCLPGAYPFPGTIWIRRPRVYAYRDRGAESGGMRYRHQQVVPTRHLPFGRNHQSTHRPLLPFKLEPAGNSTACSALRNCGWLAIVDPKRPHRPSFTLEQQRYQRAVDPPAEKDTASPMIQRRHA